MMTNILNAHHVRELVHRLLFPLYAPSNQGLKAPIFILGCGHSGTSLMLAILDGHSSIKSIKGESRVFYQPNKLFLRQKAEQIFTFRKWNKITIQDHHLRWAEKSPIHCLKIPEILISFPECKILFMVRDGRDVSCSLKKRMDNFDLAASTWRNRNETAKPFWNDPRLKLIKYEDLVQDSENALQDILSFIGEPYEPDLLSIENRKKKWYSNKISKVSYSPEVHNQYRNWQINQPIQDNSGRWVDEMSLAEKESFKRIAGDLLIELGYTSSTDW